MRCLRKFRVDLYRGTAPPPSPVNRDQGLYHGVGLLSMMDETAMLSMFDAREAVKASRRKDPTSVGGCGQLSSSVGNREETRQQGGAGGCRVRSR